MLKINYEELSEHFTVFGDKKRVNLFYLIIFLRFFSSFEMPKNEFHYLKRVPFYVFFNH